MDRPETTLRKKDYRPRIKNTRFRGFVWGLDKKRQQGRILSVIMFQRHKIKQNAEGQTSPLN